MPRRAKSRRNSARRARERGAGVTLIEVLTSIALAAVIGAVAIPNLSNLRRNAHRTAVINDLLHTVFIARSEAIKRNSVVSVCRSDDGISCANKEANWNGGWIVFENLDGDQPATLDPGEPILQRHGPIEVGVLTSNRVSFSFRPFNQGDVNGTLVYCPPGSAPKDARAIIISHTGRPRTSDRDASGKALKC